VECAFSGTEALKRLEKEDDVDVVFLDVRMPDPDGIKTVEKIKKKYPLVEVIMLTGYATVHSAVEALKFGAFDYLMKPCDLDDLISKAEQAASRKKDSEDKIRDVRMKPYISERERDEMIFRIMISFVTGFLFKFEFSNFKWIFAFFIFTFWYRLMLPPLFCSRTDHLGVPKKLPVGSH
jgi:YesN/AraC family two-component response regulator